MLESPAHLCVDPAPFRAQPMGNGMDKRAIRQACQSIRQGETLGVRCLYTCVLLDQV